MGSCINIYIYIYIYGLHFKNLLVRKPKVVLLKRMKFRYINFMTHLFQKKSRKIID